MLGIHLSKICVHIRVSRRLTKVTLIKCLSSQGIHSNGNKLNKFKFRKEMGRNWFMNRIVDE